MNYQEKKKHKQGKYVSTRTRSLNKSQLIEALNHNLRLTRKGCEKVDKPEKSNLIFDWLKTKLGKFVQKDSKLEEQKHNILSEYDEVRANHKTAWNENHKRGNHFKESKTSYAESVLWFGGKDEGDELIENSHLNTLIKKHGYTEAMKMITKQAKVHFEAMADEFGLKLVGPLVLHLDERGQPHFHQIHTSFNEETGNNPNFRQNKNGAGSKLQDIVAESFEGLGFERGITAAERRAHNERASHIANREYKQDQEEAAQLKKKLKALDRRYKKGLAKLKKLESTPANKRLQDKITELESNLAQEKQEREAIQQQLDAVIRNGERAIEQEKEKLQKQFLGFEQDLLEGRLDKEMQEEITNLKAKNEQLELRVHNQNNEIGSLKYQLKEAKDELNNDT